MNTRRWLLGATGAAFGIAAAGTTVGVLRQQRAIGRRAGEQVRLGALRGPVTTVVADDGVPLHVEIDDIAAAEGGGRHRWPRDPAGPDVTVVFVHGYCLNLDCWHFQRAAYRGLVRSVYYDQRSHGRSGRSSRENATIEQLGRDLRTVIDHVAPKGPVVLVGHSMGGMSIVALAEEFPEMIGDRVIGAALVSTTAGGLQPGRVLLPMLPQALTGRVAHRTVSTLHRGHRWVDRFRRAGAAAVTVITDRLAFGDEVPESYVRFLDEMLAATPFEVVAEFFPSFSGLDKFDYVETFARVPTSVVCGTADRLTSIGHSRKLHSRIPGSRLLECDGAGHMVIMERPDQVNAELDQLITAATTRAAAR